MDYDRYTLCPECGTGLAREIQARETLKRYPDGPGDSAAWWFRSGDWYWLHGWITAHDNPGKHYTSFMTSVMARASADDLLSWREGFAALRAGKGVLTHRG